MRAVVASLMILILPMAAVASDSKGGEDLYFGQEPPGDTPQVFAPGIISLENRYEQFLLYSPDGNGVVFSVTNSTWTEFTLNELRLDEAKWSDPDTAPFLGSSPDGIVSCHSYDMKRAFFTSSRPVYPPVNLWLSERGSDGWTEPVMVPEPVSSSGNEFEVTITEDGTLYFSSLRHGGHGDMDIYRAPLVDGGYPEIENLGPPINTTAGDDLPFIAPDESYLLFASSREGTHGLRDLYISFRAGDGWTEPINLGPDINTEGFDIYPTVSPDGKYLFFTRRHAWMATEDSDIFWVSANIIERLREVALPDR